MFKESKGIEYALEVLRVMHTPGDPIDARALAIQINNSGRMMTSQSYLAKVLPRMVKMGLLKSSDKGYQALQSLDNITVNTILDLCEMPETTNKLYNFCIELKKHLSNVKVKDVYPFA